MEYRSNEPKKLKEILQSKLQIHNIFRQVSFLSHLTRNLEIQLRFFKKIQPLKSKPLKEIEDILTSIPFLKVRQTGEGMEGKVLVRFEYNFSPTLIVVTGIHNDSINNLLQSYYCILKKQGYSENANYQTKKNAQNGFMTLIETHSKENADNLKGYLRSRKKALEEKPGNRLKIENRKVRIMTFEEQNLFTFIVDMMVEYKADYFFKSMNGEKMETSEQKPPQNGNKIVYRPFSINSLSYCQPLHHQQDQPEQQNPHIQVKSKKESQDESSESTSLNSEILETKLQDLTEDEPERAGFIFLLDQKTQELGQ